MKTENSSPPFLSGERIYLRGVRLSDVNDCYYGWMNDPEITQFLESRFQPNSIESIQEYVKSKLGSPNEIFLSIVLLQDHRHIGNIKLGPMDWIHRRGDIGIIIGEKDCWGKGYAVEAIELVVDHAFRSLNLHKLTAGCYANNPASIRCFEKAGFEREAVRRSHCYYQGKYIDVLELGRISQVG